MSDYQKPIARVLVEEKPEGWRWEWRHEDGAMSAPGLASEAVAKKHALSRLGHDYVLEWASRAEWNAMYGEKRR